MEPWLASNSWRSFCLSFPFAGITDMHDRARQFVFSKCKIQHSLYSKQLCVYIRFEAISGFG